MSPKLLIPLFLALVAATTQPATQPAADDQTAMQGHWTVTTANRRGEPAPPEKLASLHVVIEGNKITIQDEKDDDVATFTLDPSKTPKWIDLRSPKGDDKNPPILGIYSLEGDTLKLCWSKDGDPRPTDFTSTPENKQALLILKKTKTE